MFTKLGCEWNRQLGSWSAAHSSVTEAFQLLNSSRAATRAVSDVHACGRRCKLLHANHPAWKGRCAFAALVRATRSCSGWQAFVDDMGMNSSCFGNQPQPQWSVVLHRHFADCCLMR